jgi:tetratricopeptide (TPR) repeat protein
MEKDAIAVLESSDEVKNKIWLAYLLRDLDIDRSRALLKSSLEEKIDFILPYRRESIDAFSWSKNEMTTWKAEYYLALNYYAIGRKEIADQMLRDCGNRPDSEVFYRFRAQILKDETNAIRLRDYDKAFEINTLNWKQWEEAIQLNLEAENHEVATRLAAEAVKRFPENYNTSLIYAKSLLVTDEFENSISILNSIDVLPSELGRESRNIYHKAHLLLAEMHLIGGNVKKAIEVLNASKEWPENLGVGKPYVVDERMQDYLLGICYSKAKNKVEEEKALMRVVDFSDDNEEAKSINQVFLLLALEHLGQKKVLDDAIKRLEKSDNKQDILALSIYNKKKIDSDLKKDNMISLVDRISRLSSSEF